MIADAGRRPMVARIWVLLAAMIVMVVPNFATATVWHVPQDPGAATIGQALQNAQPEDTVLVSPGTYFEHDLVIPHGVYLWGDGDSMDDVVIDAEGLGRVLAITDPAAFAIWVRNLTLVGGDADLGGGIYSRGLLRITECRLTDNSANYGGAFFIEGSHTDIIACEIDGNSSRSLGGGIYCRGDGHTVMTESALIGNLADAAGGGYYAADTARFSMASNTLADNRAPLGAEGAAFATIFVFYEIILAADNHPAVVGLPSDLEREVIEPPAETVLAMDFESIPFFLCTVRHNGGFTGPIADQEGVIGNVTADPMFCKIGSPDDLATYYGVAADSPCLPENSGTCGLIGAFGQACDQVVAVPGAALPQACVLYAPAPNPFNPATTLRFAIDKPGRVQLEIFDVAGRKVTTLVDTNLPAGAHEVVWRGQDDQGGRAPSGVYLGRLAAGGQTANQRLALIK